MNRLSIVLALVSGSVLLATCSATTNADDIDYSHPWYVGAGVGISRLEPRPRQPQILQVGDNSDTGVHLFLGYTVNRWLSAELLLAVPGEARLDRIDPPNQQTDIDRIDYTIADISALFYFFNARHSRHADVANYSSPPDTFCRRGLSLYGRAGLGYMRNTSKRNAIDHGKNFDQHISFGLGVEYALANTIAMRAEVTAFDSDARYLGFSLLKRLGVSSCQQERVTEPTANGEKEPDKVFTSTSSEETEQEQQPPTVYFDFDIEDPDTASVAKLMAFTESIRSKEGDLILQGHTDSIGSTEYNHELSHSRVLSVYQFMIDQGISASRLSIDYHGELQPYSDNESEDGRRENRRVTLDWTDL